LENPLATKELESFRVEEEEDMEVKGFLFVWTKGRKDG